jgi:hypothetical protein
MRPAPEAARVLSAQAELPFQVLIPAYLPVKFDRNQAHVIVDKTGPGGEAMIELSYPDRQGGTLVLREWLAEEQAAARQIWETWCCCGAQAACNMLEASLQLGRLRVTAQLSSAGLLSWDQKRSVLQTLRPATNGQTYTSLDKVPVTGTLPPAVKVPINADGVQALTLVVTPEGYLPPHFAVRRGVPVRLVFRQLGDVGCGDELIFTWGKGQSADLKLDSAGDAQELSFTPNQTGDFQFHCPHYLYQGVMTVLD